MKLKDEDKVYRALREKNGQTLEGLYDYLNKEVPKSDILFYLNNGRVKEYIHLREGPTTREDRFFLRFVFDKVRKVTSDGFFNYNDLRTQKTQLVGSDEIEIEPKRGENIVERDQGNVGSCVAQASASLMDDIHSALRPEDNPTDEDRKEVRRNVLYDPNNPNGPYYDILFWQSFSAGGIYYHFRKLDNFTQAGYYIDYALKHLVTDGVGRDRQWIYFRDGVYAAKDPLPDADPETGEKYFETAQNHKINGFARCSNNISMINALIDHDGIGLLAAMEIAEGTFNSAKGGGVWQSWKGSSIGGHAILIKGRGKRGSTWGWYFYNSWCLQGYPRLEWMSDSYWQRAKIDCFVALDSEESAFIRDNIRQKVTIITNAPAKVYIDNVYHGDTSDNKITAQLKKEGEYILKAVKKSNPVNSVFKTVKVTPQLVEVQLFFGDDPVTPPNKPNISELIKKFLEKLKKNFGKK